MGTSTIDTRLLPTTQYSVPLTGDTVTANNSGNHTLIINPAGTLLALTLALNGAPSDGDYLTLASSQIVTGFTMSGGTIVGALTSLTAAGFATFIYNSTASKWFRAG